MRSAISKIRLTIAFEADSARTAELFVNAHGLPVASGVPRQFTCICEGTGAQMGEPGKTSSSNERNLLRRDLRGGSGLAFSRGVLEVSFSHDRTCPRDLRHGDALWAGTARAPGSPQAATILRHSNPQHDLRYLK